MKRLKNEPEFVKSPIDPTIMPISIPLRDRIIDHLKTLKKYNLKSADAVRSAFNLAFVVPDTVISDIDFAVLQFLSKNPDALFIDAARGLGIAPRTVSRSYERLQNSLMMRCCSLSDSTAFGVQSYLLFFRVKPGIEWITVEEGLSQFPFTKAIMKTSLTDLGYASFLVPTDREFSDVFQKSIDELSRFAFDYSALHIQRAVGVNVNLDLYHNGSWTFPDDFSSTLHGENPDFHIEPKLLKCKGPIHDMSVADFVVSSYLRIDYRASIRTIREVLLNKGFKFDLKGVSLIVDRLKREQVLLPYVSFGGLGLSTNFCFEIRCNPRFTEQILRALTLVPSSNYFVSSEGIIVYLALPSVHQVDYYRILVELEGCKGVSKVVPIVVAQRRGSRGAIDFVQFYDTEGHGWSIDPHASDLTKYILSS